MENTPYQIKVANILEERRRKAKAEHKAKKEAGKLMTARLKPIKRRIKYNENRIEILRERIHQDGLLLVKIRDGR